MKVLLLHLDLGIGGAERLMVNLALAMQDLGHEVKIFTSHHDLKRCFHETTLEGKLGSTITVFGDFLPRQIFGKLTAFCAILRMIYLAFQASITSFHPDVVVIDGVSVPIPLLKMSGIPVLFYCHYPDKMLCVERSSVMKRLYRLPLDILEELTTACADCIVVNSKFTGLAFKSAFAYLGKYYSPKVLYPSIEMPSSPTKNGENLSYLDGATTIFVSLNRYERKKNVLLALQAFALLLDKLKEINFSLKTIKLVIAGGYDPRVQENIEYYQELVKYTEEHSISEYVVFRRSITDNERTELLRRSSAIVYTPSNEHFGIVPCEAMSLGTPVIAVQNGGPLETVVNNETGYLCEEDPEHFKEAMFRIATDQRRAKEMGQKGIVHVKANFTTEVMRNQLQEYLLETSNHKSFPILPFLLLCGIAGIALSLLFPRLNF